jgi:hypothetical protein
MMAWAIVVMFAKWAGLQACGTMSTQESGEDQLQRQIDDLKKRVDEIQHVLRHNRAIGRSVSTAAPALLLRSKAVVTAARR